MQVRVLPRTLIGSCLRSEMDITQPSEGWFAGSSPAEDAIFPPSSGSGDALHKRARVQFESARWDCFSGCSEVVSRVFREHEIVGSIPATPTTTWDGSSIGQNSLLIRGLVWVQIPPVLLDCNLPG